MKRILSDPRLGLCGPRWGSVFCALAALLVAPAGGVAPRLAVVATPQEVTVDLSRRPERCPDSLYGEFTVVDARTGKAYFLNFDRPAKGHRAHGVFEDAYCQGRERFISAEKLCRAQNDSLKKRRKCIETHGFPHTKLPSTKNLSTAK